MDVLRKELNEVYESQHLYMERLSENDVRECIDKAKTYAELSGCCVVITDTALDRSFFLPGKVGCLLQLYESEMTPKKLSSSDEDFLYARMHPEDLVDLRMLEYKFFKMVDKLPADKKLDYQAYATVRMFTPDETYVYINKGTRVMRLSPAGKMWLILCTYDVVTHQTDVHHTHPIIVNNKTGEVQRLSFSISRSNILSDREKQVLRLIRDGKLSKEIANILQISPNTVNRHRQNILEKLSVDNSIEAVNAAIAMQLL